MISKKNYPILGFGFSTEHTEHCFLVTFPDSRAKDADILISEYFHWNPDQEVSVEASFNDRDRQIKVMLKRTIWEQIEEEVKAEFNRRLRAMGLKTGRWLKKGQVPVDRTLGKELTLLAWAIEDADPALIPTAIRNWLGLAPEERWWLYTMTNAATGHALKDRNRGWRKAVRFALTENPVMESVIRNRYSDFELTLSGR
jgi:Protein of unknown function (DUF3780)